MKRKFVLGIVAVLCIAVCLLTSSLFQITEEDEALYSAYRKQTFRNNMSTSASIIQVMEADNTLSDVAPDANVPGITDLNSSDWIEILQSVHQTWGLAGAYYDQASHSMTLWGEEVNVFWDCSGYIGFCLYKYGRTQNTHPIWSGSGWKENGQANALAFGCTYLQPGTDIDVTTDLRAGDIIFYDGHCEAFHSYGTSQTLESKPVVYNWGSNRSSRLRYFNEIKDDEGNVIGYELKPESEWRCYGNSGYALSTIKSVWRVN